MSKTTYARRISDDEFAELTRDLTAVEREEWRIERVTDPLFDMWLRFEEAFANRAIDRLDVSDTDAEVAARRMEGIGAAGAAFAYLLRRIGTQRRLRQISHKVSAVWAAAGTSEPLSFADLNERYEKLNKGDS